VAWPTEVHQQRVVLFVKKKVLCVFGTRPEAIKLAPVILELARSESAFDVVVCSTGQHREMLRQVIDLFGLRCDYDLDLMKPDQSLAGLTAALLTSLDRVVAGCRPDWVLAQGDTTTAMTAALVSFYRGVRFAHVEAGLRTGNKRHPFPEEINRRIADLTADLYFPPTERSRAVLLQEGIAPESVHMVGNTVVDALLDVAARTYDWAAGPLQHLPQNKRLVLITAHRRESFGEPFRELCLGIRELATAFASDGVHFVYPVHLNPNVQQPVREILGTCENLSLIPPLDYAALVHLMKRSALILTDSGGIQEEAPSFSVPVLVMRETTERPEGVEAGVVKLVGTDRNCIVGEATNLLRNPALAAAMKSERNPYGDGHAARRIVQILKQQA
jgi:UDP-N-acetylglucosamine 2-epimerase